MSGYGETQQVAMKIVFPQEITLEQAQKLGTKIAERLKEVSKLEVEQPTFQTFDPNYEVITLYVP